VVQVLDDRVYAIVKPAGVSNKGRQGAIATEMDTGALMCSCKWYCLPGLTP
jgi:hypothetical protein